MSTTLDTLATFWLALQLCGLVPGVIIVALCIVVGTWARIDEWVSKRRRAKRKEEGA